MTLVRQPIYTVAHGLVGWMEVEIPPFTPRLTPEQIAEVSRPRRVMLSDRMQEAIIQQEAEQEVEDCLTGADIARRIDEL